MTDKELIIKSMIAWHDNKSTYIHLPIYATDGTRLMDISFKKQGHEWVGQINHEQMVELVQAAAILMEKNND